MKLEHKMALYVFFLFVFTSSEAWVASKYLSPNSDYPGMCYDPEGYNGNPMVLEDGESFNLPGQCYKSTCSSSKHGFLLSHTGCVLVASREPGCNVVSDNTLPFPNCCPTIKC